MTMITNGNDNNDVMTNTLLRHQIHATNFDTYNLSSETIDSQDVRIIAYFDNCDLDSASLHLNIIQNSDIKLVAAN